MQKAWTLIILVAFVLLSTLGYLGFKYYSITKKPIAKVLNSPTPEPIIPRPDPFESSTTIGTFSGEVSCIELIQLEKGEECRLGFITENGDKMLLSSGLPDFVNQIKRGDKLRIEGVIATPNPDQDKVKHPFLIVRDFVKI